MRRKIAVWRQSGIETVCVFEFLSAYGAPLALYTYIMPPIILGKWRVGQKI